MPPIDIHRISQIGLRISRVVMSDAHHNIQERETQKHSPTKTRDLLERTWRDYCHCKGEPENKFLMVPGVSA